MILSFMIRVLICVTSSMLAGSLMSSAAEPTTKDIARHLGISTWKIPAAEQKRRVMVLAVKDGEVVTESNRQVGSFGGEVTVTLSSEGKKVKVMISGKTMSSTHSIESAQGEGVFDYFQGKVVAGDYLLTGTWMNQSGELSAPEKGDFSNIKEGIILRIYPKLRGAK